MSESKIPNWLSAWREVLIEGLVAAFSALVISTQGLGVLKVFFQDNTTVAIFTAALLISLGAIAAVPISIQNKKSELSEVNSKLERLKERESDLSTTIKSLNQNKAHLMSSIDELKCTVAETKQRRDRARDEKAELDAKIDERRQQLQELEVELRSASIRAATSAVIDAVSTFFGDHR